MLVESPENSPVVPAAALGKISNNAFIVTFNGRLREECSNANWFLCLEGARMKVAALREEYNRKQPYGILSNFRPFEFILAKELVC